MTSRGSVASSSSARSRDGGTAAAPGPLRSLATRRLTRRLRAVSSDKRRLLGGVVAREYLGRRAAMDDLAPFEEHRRVAHRTDRLLRMRGLDDDAGAGDKGPQPRLRFLLGGGVAHQELLVENQDVR